MTTAACGRDRSRRWRKPRPVRNRRIDARDKLADLVRAVYGKPGVHRHDDDASRVGSRGGGRQVLVPVTASITSEGGQYRVAELHLEATFL